MKWCQHIKWDKKIKQWFLHYKNGSTRLIWDAETECACGKPRPRKER